MADVRPGIAGVETTLPLFLNAVSDGRLSLGTVGGRDLRRAGARSGVWPAKAG